jgi:hypothetical protein
MLLPRGSILLLRRQTLELPNQRALKGMCARSYLLVVYIMLLLRGSILLLLLTL